MDVVIQNLQKLYKKLYIFLTLEGFEQARPERRDVSQERSGEGYLIVIVTRMGEGLTHGPSRLVLFDLDNTLIDRVAAFRIWATGFVRDRDLGAEREVAWLEEADRDGFAPRPAFFEHVRARFGLIDSVDVLVEDYGEIYPECVAPPPAETFTALERLRSAGWKVGVVTNGLPTQQAKFHAAQLAGVLDGWVISGVVGVRKPDPAIFAEAARACGVGLGGAWVVGDSPEADIGGAVNCGLRSVWIRRGRDWEIREYEPDAMVDSIREAAAVVLASDAV